MVGCSEDNVAVGAHDVVFLLARVSDRLKRLQLLNFTEKMFYECPDGLV